MQSQQEFQNALPGTSSMNAGLHKNGMTIHQALADVAGTLAKHGIDHPLIEAEILLAHILSCNRTVLYAHALRRLSKEQDRSLRRAIDLRLSRMPVQYITGSAPFHRFTLQVNTDVLIPRPETEVLVDEVFKRLNSNGIKNKPQVICDIGAGSGNIAIAMADAYPEARVYATDLSMAALAVARRNAAEHHCRHIVFVQGDLCEPLRSLSLHKSVDVVICNPPYIPTPDLEGLAREVREFEPRLALDGGEDGLSVIRRLIKEVSCLLKSGGLLALEVGQGQAWPVVGMIRGSGHFSEAEVIRDLSDIERVVLGNRT